MNEEIKSSAILQNLNEPSNIDDTTSKLDTIFKYCIPNNYYLLPTKIDNKKSFKLIKQEEVY